MEHSFATDPVKQLYRDRIEAFVRKHYDLRERLKAKVLCLPGPEMSGISHYDNLGVKRRNIHGVEKFPDAHAQLEARVAEERPKNRIRVAPPQDLLDFLRTTNQKFDIIELDYCGYFSRDVVGAIQYIARRQLLPERGILIVNVQAKRENRARQNDFWDFYTGIQDGINKTIDASEELVTSEQEFEELVDEMVEGLIYPEQKKAESDIELRRLREEVFSRRIAISMAFGKSPYEVVELFNEEYLDSIVDNMIKFQRRVDEKTKGRFFKEYDYIRQVIEDNNKDEVITIGSGTAVLRVQIIRNLANNLPERIHHMIPALACFLYAKYSRPYFAEHLDCFRYVSQPGNTPMVCDIGLYNQRRDLFSYKDVKLAMRKIEGKYNIDWKLSKATHKKASRVRTFDRERDKQEIEKLELADFEGQFKHVDRYYQLQVGFYDRLGKPMPERVELRLK